MLPTIMSAFADFESDKAKYIAICGLNSAKQIRIEVNLSTHHYEPWKPALTKAISSRGGEPAGARRLS